MKLKPINQKLSQSLSLNFIPIPFTIPVQNKVTTSMVVRLINSNQTLSFFTFTYLNNGFKIN